MVQWFDENGRLIVEIDVGAFAAGLRPPTPDDLSITLDGRRIDTADTVRELVDEFRRRQVTVVAG